jgi:hypothetical protein
MRIATILIITLVILVFVLNIVGNQLDLSEKEMIKEETTIIETITNDGEVIGTEITTQNTSTNDSE